MNRTTKSSVQTKLAFKTAQSPSQPKIDPTEVLNKIKQTGEWNIEDFLLDPQWKKFLNDEFDKKYFQDINKFIKEGYKKNIVRPPKELVFNALNSTSLMNIKVVIIGQDPYHDDGQVNSFFST